MAFHKTGVSPVEYILCSCGEKLSKRAKKCKKCGKALDKTTKKEKENE